MFDVSRVNHMMYNVLERGVFELHLSPICQWARAWVLQYIRHWLNSIYLMEVITNAIFLRAVFSSLHSKLSLSLFLVSFVAFKPSGLYDCLLTSPMLEEVNICDQDPLRPLLYSGLGKTGLGFIHPENIRSHDIKDHSCFVIKTPNLVYLDYSSYVAQSYGWDIIWRIWSVLKWSKLRFKWMIKISTYHSPWANEAPSYSHFQVQHPVHVILVTLVSFFWLSFYISDASNLEVDTVLVWGIV